MTTLVSRATRFTLGVLTTAVMVAELATAAEPAPLRLTRLQLDTVNAGLVAVAAIATAVALGGSGRTSTQTNTRTKSLANGVVELGFARGKAYACCGPYTDANVVTDSYADGVIVAGHRTNIKNVNPRFTRAHGNEVIVSVNPPGLVGR